MYNIEKYVINIIYLKKDLLKIKERDLIHIL